jgi:hypothetical protein
MIAVGAKYNLHPAAPVLHRAISDSDINEYDDSCIRK